MNGKSRNYTLGISWGHADPSVTLVLDGSVVVYVEEERLSRIKHDFGSFPLKALKECLFIAGIDLSTVKAIAINWDLGKYEDGSIEKHYREINDTERPSRNTLIWQKGNLQKYTESSVSNMLRQEFQREYGAINLPPIRCYPHHHIHAWHSVVASGFQETLVFVMDGSGDDLTTSLWKYVSNELKLIDSIKIPHSLGWFYAAITEFLGFKAYDGEHKVMAMAGHGVFNLALQESMSKILTITQDGFRVDSSYIHNGLHTYSDRFTDKLYSELGVAPKLSSADFKQVHFDIALAAQNQLSRAALNFLIRSVDISEHINLCLSGGVALNVSLGNFLKRNTKIPNVFANPLSSDAGAVIGAALYCNVEGDARKVKYPESLSLGRRYKDIEIEQLLISQGRDYQNIENGISDVVDNLVNGKLVALFSGGSEAGPRALGSRSILCDPRNGSSINRLSTQVKNREVWQPYGVSFISEKAHLYLAEKCISEFMSIAVKASESFIEVCPNAVHIDHTVRPHLVKENRDYLLHKIIYEFGKKTGVYALINTSLNRKGEPMPYTPTDALCIFDESPIDIIIMQSYIVGKI